MALGDDLGKNAVDELTDKTLPELDEDLKQFISTVDAMVRGWLNDYSINVTITKKVS